MPQAGPSGLARPQTFPPEFLTAGNETDSASDVDEPMVAASEADKAESVPRKGKQYSQIRKCRDDWLKQFNWLLSKNDRAYCKFCHRFIEGGLNHMRRHEATKFHLKNIKKLKGVMPIEKQLSESIFSKRRLYKEAVLKIAVHVAEHNLSFNYMEHANKFYPHMFPDSDIASNLHCSRTKTTELIKNVIAPYVRNKLAMKMRTTMFAIIIDETTDVSIKKSLAVAVRFFDDEIKRVKDRCFALIEIENATADGLFQEICALLKNNNIPINNLVGFAADNASVMMGNINGVKAKFQQVLPNLFVMPCVSHSLHLCASKACKALPSDLERLCHEIYNHFSHSAKRKKSFEEFQHFTENEPHQLLRPCQTRWLSLYMVVERICEQWSPLTLFFQAEVLEDNIYSATFILDSLLNPVIHVYFLFLKHILMMVIKMNTFFQAESPKFHVFVSRISSLYKTVLKFFLKPGVINSLPLSRINPVNPDYFLPLNNIYIGAEAEQLLLSQHVSEYDICDIKKKCLAFYTTLCSEIRTRINFDDEILKSLEILNPENVFSDGKPSLVELVSKFPNIVHQKNINDLNLEWRQLSDVKPRNENITSIEDLIVYIEKLQDGAGDQLFPFLTLFLKNISCLPHSSVAAERIFSQLSIIKTKYRNKLNMDTCDALLLTKQLTENTSCFSWKPPDELLKLIK